MGLNTNSVTDENVCVSCPTGSAEHVTSAFCRRVGREYYFDLDKQPVVVFRLSGMLGERALQDQSVVGGPQLLQVPSGLAPRQ